VRCSRRAACTPSSTRRKARLQRGRDLFEARADKAILGLGIEEIDAQGRFLQLDAGNLSVISLYMPSGTMGEEAQKRKYSSWSDSSRASNRCARAGASS
jgi:exonuclease III